jgi:hypothetical protein
LVDVFLHASPREGTERVNEGRFRSAPRAADTFPVTETAPVGEVLEKRFRVFGSAV